MRGQRQAVTLPKCGNGGVSDAVTSELGDRQSSHPVKTLLQSYGKSLEALLTPVSGTTAAPYIPKLDFKKIHKISADPGGLPACQRDTIIDVKRGQTLEAEIEAKAGTLRSRLRPRPNLKRQNRIFNLVMQYMCLSLTSK